MKKFEGKVALVTGAGEGIGRTTALSLGLLGAKVIVTDINTETGTKTTDLIIEAGGYAKFFKLDVSNQKDVASICKEIQKTEGSIELAVNNAGIGDIVGPIHEISSENWQQMLSICLSGVFYCMQEELKQMLSAGGGKIVNVASLAGIYGVPKGAHYAAAKHGVIGLTKSAAVEYGSHNIRVNAVCPGFIQTAMLNNVPQKALDYSSNFRVPLKRVGTKQEVANSIVWLLSDEASFINGEQLLIDGGFSAS